ncbi:hypothetical protein Poli38472_000500 [Pythium oligandrum]|uniref:Uncharacterized protein n=1 Tax=Pythium oligandrum TaxID=41045 RepID=A0A8K1CD75_PYTOL|nr:hypothetical protein Poli38472_000500 [Pythium oligandrum]|eukprot:TMW60458.1 hypothetical protein Poli38472_000500 [Pythium oligandrum]
MAGDDDEDEMFEAIASLFEDPVEGEVTPDAIWMSILDEDDELERLETLQASGRAGTASQAEKRKRRARDNPNKARDARRHELLHLRSTVAQLEDVVTQLRQQHEAKGGSNPVGRNVMIRRSVWEPIAARQLEERRRAEELNTQLRILLADQTRLTKSLERMVTKPSTMQGFETCGLLKPRRSFVPPSYKYDPSVCKDMLREVESNYNEVDALFERLHLKDEEHSSGNLQVHRDEKSGYLESYQLEVLPVNVQVAADLVWQHYAEHMSRVPFRQYYERTAAADDVTEDTIIERIGVELQSSETITTTSLQVMRRYTEENRVVIVWYCIMRPVMCASQNVATVDFLERGYMVFETPKALDPASHSILKMCVTLCRSHDGFRDDDELQRKVDECMFMDGIAMASTLHRSIENMLLERCRSHSFYQQTEPQIPSGP